MTIHCKHLDNARNWGKCTHKRCKTETNSAHVNRCLSILRMPMYIYCYSLKFYTWCSHDVLSCQHYSRHSRHSTTPNCSLGYLLSFPWVSLCPFLYSLSWLVSFFPFLGLACVFFFPFLGLACVLFCVCLGWFVSFFPFLGLACVLFVFLELACVLFSITWTAWAPSAGILFRRKEIGFQHPVIHDGYILWHTCSCRTESH